MQKIGRACQPSTFVFGSKICRRRQQQLFQSTNVSSVFALTFVQVLNENKVLLFDLYARLFDRNVAKGFGTE